MPGPATLGQGQQPILNVSVLLLPFLEYHVWTCDLFFFSIKLLSNNPCHL
jgi:hypothetical protein